MYGEFKLEFPKKIYFHLNLYSPVKMFCSSRQHIYLGVVGSKHQVPLPTRGLLVKFSVE